MRVVRTLAGREDQGENVSASRLSAINAVRPTVFPSSHQAEDQFFVAIESKQVAQHHREVKISTVCIARGPNYRFNTFAFHPPKLACMEGNLTVEQCRAILVQRTIF